MLSSLMHILPFLSYPFFPEIFIALMALSLLIVGAYYGDVMADKFSWISSGICLIAIVMYAEIGFEAKNYLNIMYKTNFFIIVAKILILTTTILSLILFSGHSRYNTNITRFEYPILVLFSTLGMLIAVSANDFLTLYMGIELQAIATYILVGINRGNSKSSEAGLKYFILGALASGILLYGISLIYGFTGSIFFSNIGTYFSENILSDNTINLGVIFGMVMIIIAICFKLSAVPFHMWAIDVYEGSPTAVTVFLSSAHKITALIVAIRILLEPFALLYRDWGQMLTIIAVISMLVGALGAIRQTNIKRLLAYSSISHIGFMLIGIIVFDFEGVKATLIYMSIYVVMIIGAFALLMLIKQSHSSSDSSDKKPLEDIHALSGLINSLPLTTISMTILMLSMAGIPPLAGFFSKFFIFSVAIRSGHILLVVIGGISAVIAAYYYLKIIKIMFFDKSIEIYNKKPTIPTIIILLVAVIINLLFFIKPTVFFDFAELAAQAIF